MQTLVSRTSCNAKALQLVRDPGGHTRAAAWAPAQQRTAKEALRCVRGTRPELDAPISLNAVIARSSCDEAIQNLSAEGFLDCFASLAMTEREAFAIVH